MDHVRKDLANAMLQGRGISRRSLLKTSAVGSSAILASQMFGFGEEKMLADVGSQTIGIGQVVATTSGKVRGLTRNDVQIFRSIPYGATTAAPYRFMPPRKPEP